MTGTATFVALAALLLLAVLWPLIGRLRDRVPTTLQRAQACDLPVALLREQSDLDRRSALEPWLQCSEHR